MLVCGEKLKWNGSYPKTCCSLNEDTGVFFNWFCLLSASQHQDWVLLLLWEMQQKSRLEMTVQTFGQIITYLSAPKFGSWWRQWESRQLVAIHYQGGGLTLFEWCLEGFDHTLFLLISPFKFFCGIFSGISLLYILHSLGCKIFSGARYDDWLLLCVRKEKLPSLSMKLQSLPLYCSCVRCRRFFARQ